MTTQTTKARTTKASKTQGARKPSNDHYHATNLDPDLFHYHGDHNSPEVGDTVQFVTNLPPGQWTVESIEKGKSPSGKTLATVSLKGWPSDVPVMDLLLMARRLKVRGTGAVSPGAGPHYHDSLMAPEVGDVVNFGPNDENQDEYTVEAVLDDGMALRLKGAGPHNRTPTSTLHLVRRNTTTEPALHYPSHPDHYLGAIIYPEVGDQVRFESATSIGSFTVLKVHGNGTVSLGAGAWDSVPLSKLCIMERAATAFKGPVTDEVFYADHRTSPEIWDVVNYGPRDENTKEYTVEAIATDGAYLYVQGKATPLATRNMYLVRRTDGFPIYASGETPKAGDIVVSKDRDDAVYKVHMFTRESNGPLQLFFMGHPSADPRGFKLYARPHTPHPSASFGTPMFYANGELPYNGDEVIRLQDNTTWTVVTVHGGNTGVINMVGANGETNAQAVSCKLVCRGPNLKTAKGILEARNTLLELTQRQTLTNGQRATLLAVTAALIQLEPKN